MFAGCGSVPILGPQAVSTRGIAPIASRDIHTAAAASDTHVWVAGAQYSPSIVPHTSTGVTELVSSVNFCSNAHVLRSHDLSWAQGAVGRRMTGTTIRYILNVCILVHWAMFTEFYWPLGHWVQCMYVQPTQLPPVLARALPLLYEVAKIATTKKRSRGRGARPAGLKYTVDVSCNSDFHEKVLLEKLLPKLQCAWGTEQNITVQTDNAGPQKGDQAYDAFSGFENIEMVRQSANSPDFNILDEGIFHVLQTAVDKERPYFEKNTFKARRQLQECVAKAWRDMPGAKIKACAEHMNDVFRNVKRLNGGNFYRHASLQ